MHVSAREQYRSAELRPFRADHAALLADGAGPGLTQGRGIRPHPHEVVGVLGTHRRRIKRIVESGAWRVVRAGESSRRGCARALAAIKQRTARVRKLLDAAHLSRCGWDGMMCRQCATGAR